MLFTILFGATIAELMKIVKPSLSHPIECIHSHVWRRVRSCLCERMSNDLVVLPDYTFYRSMSFLPLHEIDVVRTTE